MPALNAGGIEEKGFRIQLVDHRGGDAAVSFSDLPSATTDGMLSVLANAVGVVSNAAIYSEHITAKTYKRKTDVSALDEAESSVATKAVLVFEDKTGQRRTVGIPAPDRSRMNSTFTGLDTSDAGVASLIDAIIAAFNGGLVGAAGPDYQFRQSSIQYTSRARASTPVLPNVGEPNPTTND